MFMDLFRRPFATLAPKPTSKRSKSRMQLLQGLPRPQLTRKQHLSPVHNHVLRANKEVSKRERHFRRCVMQAECATIPHNPDLSVFVPPYWMQVSAVESRKQLSGYFDPFVQSVANTRIVRAISARSDPSLKKTMLQSGLICEDDLKEVEEMIKRRECPSHVPLLDKVLMQCENEISQVIKQALDGDSCNTIYKHGLHCDKDEIDLLLGSIDTDVERALVSPGLLSTSTNAKPGGIVVELDEKRDLIKRIIGMSTANAQEKIKYMKHQVFEAFRRHESDYGSVQVQAAMLSLRIRNQLKHLYLNPQDNRTRVIVDHLTHRRRKLLDSLRKSDFPQYMKTVRNLGLKMA